MNNFVAGLIGYAVIGVAVLVSNAGRKKLRETKRDLNPQLNPFVPPRKYPLWKHIALYTCVGLAAIALWPLLVTEAVKEAIKDARRNTPEAYRKSRAQEVHKEWLRKRITVEEAEAKHLVDFSGESEARLAFARSKGVILTGKPVPFGFGNRQWRKFVASMQEGDELWEFNSSDLSWQNRAGRAGIAIVRNGEIFDRMITSLN